MIPKRFDLINRTYTVAPFRDSNSKSELQGYCNTSECVILIDTDVGQEQQEHVFFHELLHAWFDAAGKPDLSKDEALVDLMGSVIHQYMQTHEGNF